MPIGILYESEEWSSYALRDYINSMDVEVRFFNMQEDVSEAGLLVCDLIVNRIFASAVFRGHQKALDRMPGVIELLRKNNIPMINPYEAHFYEISKEHTSKTLASCGFPVPKIYGVFFPEQITACADIEYPCIVKPDCGGRTTHTFILRSHSELCESMQKAPRIKFVAQEYIEPECGYITRIEIIDRTCKLILKRSIAENGLSAYHLGVAYTAYSDCPVEIQNAAVGAMDLLQIETGSMDMIENKNGFYIIDVNSVSNASEDNTEMFSFDLMKETAAYAVKKYQQLKGEKPCK